MTDSDPYTPTDTAPEGAPPPTSIDNALSPEKKLHQHDFLFSGKGSEYFRIWIVNLALSIITLGIYSAWATVRTRKYFYGNTHLAGASFEYLASPIAILKGRIIGVVLFAIYLAASNFAPPDVQPFVVIFLWLFVPFLVVRSLAFRAQNSSYRGVRFDFQGDMKTAYLRYLGLALLVPLTLGLIIPYMIYKQVDYSASNHRFGQEKFSFSAKARQYYAIFLVPFLIISFFIGGMFFIGYTVSDEGFAGILNISFLVFYALFLILSAFIYVRKLNILFNSTKIGDDISFTASYRMRTLVWIWFTNFLGMIFTLGLYYPWAKVRLANFRAQYLTLVALTDLDHFVDQQVANTSATGDEVGDIFSVDVGI